MNEPRPDLVPPEVEALAADLARRLREGGQFCTSALFCDAAGMTFLLGLHQRTLRKWRRSGSGPRAMRTNRVVYDLREVAAWLTREESEGTGGAAGGIDDPQEDRHASSRRPPVARARR